MELPALMNLLALHGYEINDCDGQQITIMRLSDNMKFKTSAWTIGQWMRNIRTWNSLVEIAPYSYSKKYP